MPQVSLVHDYLTQRGGAERVVLSMHKAFPKAPVYTSLYEPDATFPEFRSLDVRTSPINRVPLWRRNHRIALPLLAPTFTRLRVPGDVVVCSSSGWAHGAKVEGRKIVYCYTPARWLYQPDLYLGSASGLAKPLLRALRPALVRWDRRAAESADAYITSSTEVQRRIADAYGIEATVLPPPPTLDPGGLASPIPQLEPGFFLCVSRLLPYKNVGAAVRAFSSLPGERLVVVGSGPERAALARLAGSNVELMERVTDEELRWLYANARAVLAPSHEDYGLVPLEALTFGVPAIALRWGGFLDTVVEGETGVFFDDPRPECIRDAITDFDHVAWSVRSLERQARRFSEATFISRLQELAEAEVLRR